MKIFYAMGIGLLGGALLSADPSKLSPDLKVASNSGNVKVIVHYKMPITSANIASLPLVGGLLNQTFATLNMIVLTLPLQNLALLSDLPTVDYITPDRPLTQLLDYSNAAVNAGAAKQTGLTGTGIGVAVVDSGVADSADLNTGLLGRVVYRENFSAAPSLLNMLGSVTATTTDGFGHGTHVAGIIAGNGAASQCLNCTRSLSGLAPTANLIDLRVLDSTGQGSDSSVLAAIERAIQLRTLYNIRVLNLSLGRGVYESYTKDPLCQAVEAAWKSGITVVVAAGNSGRDNSVGNNGYGTIQSPANDPAVITVGAMKAMDTYSRTDDLIASYSSKGPSAIDFVAKPDLVAPGNHVVSIAAPGSELAASPDTAVPFSYYQATNNSNRSPKYLMLNGTSMATPVVSGAVADLLQAEPKLTPDQVKARLMKTAYRNFPVTSTAVDPATGDSFTSTYDLFTVGAGYLDLAAALADHSVAAGTAATPVAVFDATTLKVNLSFSPASVWSTWGAQNVWGTRNIGVDRSVWGTQTVWSNSTVDGFRAIWGSRGVWGTATDAANSGLNGTRAIWGTNLRTSDSDTNFTVKQ